MTEIMEHGSDRRIREWMDYLNEKVYPFVRWAAGSAIFNRLLEVDKLSNEELEQLAATDGELYRQWEWLAQLTALYGPASQAKYN